MSYCSIMEKINFYGLDYSYYDHPNKYSLILYCSWCNLRCYGCHNRTLWWWVYDEEISLQKGSSPTENTLMHKDELQNICKSWKIDYSWQRVEFDTAVCHNKMSEDEIKDAVSSEMLDMVILCWWELLIYPVEKIKKTVDWIKELNPNVLIRIDTNGTFPEKVQELTDWGRIDGFGIDIKWPYWSEDYYGHISSVVWWPEQIASKLFPKMVESLNISKRLEHTVYRTVKYPIIDEEKYFSEIKSYVWVELWKPHYFNSFVEL